MQKQPARVTVRCLRCGGQLVVRIRFPTVEHRATKRPEIIDWHCLADCELSEALVRQLIGL